MSWPDILLLKNEPEEITETGVDLLKEKAIKNPLRKSLIRRERVLLHGHLREEQSTYSEHHLSSRRHSSFRTEV
ncbi:hypothetical protein CSA37_03510 [Candidatus Fermentibacteria bacterium]|nr:MAG: hypothetical protein CSA37_03510 [Candidatus Fermentibacteria bacterium]